VTFVVVLLAVAMVFLSLCFLLAKDVVEAIESFVDRAAVTLQPGVELVERFRAQAVDPLLRHRMDLDEPGIAQNTQMLRDLGLPEPEPHSDLPDRQGPAAKELDDLEPVRFREGAQRVLHGTLYTP